METILIKTKTPDMQAKAEATFKRKEIQAREGAIAMAEYSASLNVMRAKTERLRALRLAKETADAEAPETKPVAKPAARGSARRKAR